MTFEEIVEAYFQCRKNKRYTKEALAFEIDCEDNLVRLYEELSSGTYEIGPSKVFIVDKPVKREVFAAMFRDRILHHWLHAQLNPLMEKEFIHDSYACRKGKGTLFAQRRLKRFIAQCSENYTKDCYILRCDIRGFFMNIDRELLANKLEEFIWRHYTREDLLLVCKLVRQVVMKSPFDGCHINSPAAKWDGLPDNKSIFTCNGYPMPNGWLPKPGLRGRRKGLPIGNLTSQLFANFYLNGLDHFIKHTLQIRYYGRYMDDFIMVHPDKNYLLKVKEKCAAYLSTELLLDLHPNKVYLQHYSKGVEFVGVKIRKGAMIPGKKIRCNTWLTIRNYNQLARTRKLHSHEMKAFRQSMNSYLGIMIHAQSYRLRKKFLGSVSGWIANDIYYPGYAKVVLKKQPLHPVKFGFDPDSPVIYRKDL
ncbi:MAG: RNA-directed DNA polymerase [Tannerellaceae bacterium]|nr:RNA-directed DNA polymerase [Tannerellaceae bacterium]